MRRQIAIHVAVLGAVLSGSCSPGGGGGSGTSDPAPSVNAPYEQDFDGSNPLEGWLFYDPEESTTPPSPTVVTLWKVDGTPEDMPGGAFSSGSKSLNYNNGTNYETNIIWWNSGIAISPKLNIAGLANPVLTFQCNYQTEGTGTAMDQRKVGVGYLGSNGQPVYYYSGQLSSTAPASDPTHCPSMENWHAHTIPLNPSWGEIRVAFLFDTVDMFYNNFKGWFIDDFKVVQSGNGAVTGGGSGNSSGGNSGTGGNSASVSPAPGTTIQSTSFDTAAAVVGWTLGGSGGVGWAADATPSTFPGGVAISGPNSLNYNNGTDYDSGLTNSGSAKSPPVNLAGYSNPQLRFKCNYQTETTGTDLDRRFVKVYSNGGAAPVVTAQLATVGNWATVGPCAAMGQWHEHTVLLDPGWGVVTVEFLFDTVDSKNNKYAGWAVDEFAIMADSTSAGSVASNSESKSDGSGGGCGGSVSGDGPVSGLWPPLLLMILLGALRLRVKKALKS